MIKFIKRNIYILLFVIIHLINYEKQFIILEPTEIFISAFLFYFLLKVISLKIYLLKKALQIAIILAFIYIVFI